MNKEAIKKVNTFGKVGNIILIVLIVLAITATVLITAGTVYLSTLPNDGVTVSVSGNAKIQVDAKHFSVLWNAVTDGFSYSSNELPSSLTSDNATAITPPEDQEMQVKVSLFNSNFSSASIHSEGEQKIIEATTEPSVYKSADLIKVLICIIAFLIASIVSLWTLKNLFKVISKCDSPFSEAIVRKMRIFSFSLIPLAILSTLSETLSSSFLSAGMNFNISVQWGYILAFVVSFCLVTVFKYGTQLQHESDETL